ncbi:MAG: CO dehydrogenase/acetyl-CoA synthase complex subunit epsilon [Candidatus Bathyarchaeia archaeon]
MSIVKPWDSGNVPGPVMAKILNSKIAVELIREAKRPLLIVGADSAEVDVKGKKLIDYAVELSKKIPLVTTARVIREFVKRGIQPQGSMPLSNITDRLRDGEWMGLDGKGPYDLVIFMGIHYYFESQMLSTLKHFAPAVRTISLDRGYQPNANFSFPNLREENWGEELEKIIKELG